MGYSAVCRQLYSIASLLVTYTRLRSVIQDMQASGSRGPKSDVHRHIVRMTAYEYYNPNSGLACDLLHQERSYDET